MEFSQCHSNDITSAPISYEEAMLKQQEEKLNTELSIINSNLVSHKCFIKSYFTCCTKRRVPHSKTPYKSPRKGSKSIGYQHARSANGKSFIANKSHVLHEKHLSENKCKDYSRFLNPSSGKQKKPSNTGRNRSEDTGLSVSKNLSWERIVLENPRRPFKSQSSRTVMGNYSQDLKDKICYLYRKVNDLTKEKEEMILRFEREKEIWGNEKKMFIDTQETLLEQIKQLSLSIEVLKDHLKIKSHYIL